MDENPELMLKKLCCTCLSQDRKLKQLCRLPDGINNLYFLLSYDSEAYREGFYKDTVNWYICWECWAVMRKISRFRKQACLAQKHLSDIAYGRTDLKLLNICLSKLRCTHKISYDKTIQSYLDITDNFIDCGLDIKSESDEDIPLSELHNTSFDDRQHSDNDTGSQETKNIQPVYKKRKKNSDSSKKKKRSSKSCSKIDSGKEYFNMTEMNEEEMCESRNKRKMAAIYADAAFKCESCIEGFKEEIDLNAHALDFHTEKLKHIKCDICLSNVKPTALRAHRDTHYKKYSCTFCNTITYKASEIINHLMSEHAIENVSVPAVKYKGDKKRRVLNPGSKPRRNAVMLDKQTPLGYQCDECDKYFNNKNQRWKHVQKMHREGHQCGHCGKRFAFKNNLARHEQIHKSPPPREECPHCRKQVRVDLLKIHLRIHSQRQQYECIECDKRFASRASYEHHLKYTRVHAPLLQLKYRCSTCDKGYRSKAELRDHVNYQHLGRTQHKCPICGKALATRRCVGRHVRRAHQGVREAKKDKICQQCGKAFRDKKGLREHEWIHLGLRPLTCKECGGAFRQSASLHAHARRAHNTTRQEKTITIVGDDDK